MEFKKLNNGQTIPQLGLGVYKVAPDVAVQVVRDAVEVGYRRIDTAAFYDNEVEIGEGVRACSIAREEIYVTTKIWNDHHGFEPATAAIDASLKRLDLDYIDMLLIHWPVPSQNKFIETWRAFEAAVESGKVRGIGVSNFNPNHLDELLAATGTVPAINQIELHPGLQQNELRSFDAKHGIATEAWSPLGRARFEESEILRNIASKHGKSVSQVILRWHIQLGNLVIPKTTSAARLAENIDVFDFQLDDSEMAQIATLDQGLRIGPKPEEM